METKQTIRGCQKEVKRCTECGKILSWHLNKSLLCSHHLRIKSRLERMEKKIDTLIKQEEPEVKKDPEYLKYFR